VKTETSANPPSVTLVIVSDPLHLIARARVEVSADHGPEKKLEGSGRGRITIALPHGDRLDLRVQALDVHGNRVVELGSKDVPIVITGARAEPVHEHGAGIGGGHESHGGTIGIEKTPPPPPVHPRPLWARWWLWGGVSVAFAGGASFFGLQARSEADQLNQLNANSQAHTFDEATSLEGRARRDVLLFNIGSIAAGTFAVGAVILYLTAPHVTAETRLAAVPVRGGGEVVLGGHF
jgi:hypothetical protein